MPLEKLLDLSTAHMTANDDKLLHAYDCSPRSRGAMICYPIEGGFTISTSCMRIGPADRREAIKAIRKEGFSEAFINVLKHAADQDAVLVRFDRDAGYEPGLPCFNWETGDEMSMDDAPLKM